MDTGNKLIITLLVVIVGIISIVLLFQVHSAFALLVFILVPVVRALIGTIQHEYREQYGNEINKE